MAIFYLNGDFIEAKQARIDPNDRGFLLADGVFETLRCDDGEACDLQAHYDRLKNGAKRLEITFSKTFDDIQKIIAQLLIKNNTKNGGLRITLTRGVSARGLIPKKNGGNTLLISLFECPQRPDAFSATISSIRRNETSPLSQIKSLSYLDNILAQQEAIKKGYDQAILLNTKNELACTSMANIFIVKKEQLFTPALECGVLPGITRQKIIDLAKTLRISCEEVIIDQKELLEADEIFITNSLMGIKPIAQLDERTLPSYVITKKIQEFYCNGFLLSQE